MVWALVLDRTCASHLGPSTNHVIFLTQHISIFFLFLDQELSRSSARSHISIDYTLHWLLTLLAWRLPCAGLFEFFFISTYVRFLSWDTIMKLSIYLTSAVYACIALAASPADWRSRSIYQVLTDRFARTDGSTTAACPTEDRRYCGGTYRGIISRLDYIQGMGFDAVCFCPLSQIEYKLTFATRYGSLLSPVR